MERVSALPNERVNIDDYEDGAGGRLVQLDHFRQTSTMELPDGRITDTFDVLNGAATPARVLGGFDWNPAISFGVDSTATLRRGRGIFPLIDDQNARRFGLAFGDEGPTTILVDFATAAISSVQSVYVRAVQTQATFANRVFWNPSGAPAREFVDNVSTRLVTSWEVLFQVSSAPPPGNGEYVKMWEVTINGSGKISAILDFRQFYFEGDPRSTPTAYAVQWGNGGTDRNADRANYGVQDQSMWNQAIRRQVDDIIGQAGWYKQVPTNLTKMFRYVTVTQPSGVAGDYATVAAAVTALNASTGGGTILLKKGEYDITAELTTSKTVNVIGVEEGVVLRNKIAAAAKYVFVLGDSPHRFENISVLDHASLSSEGAFRLNGSTKPTILINCVVQGEIHTNVANITAIGSSFQDAVTNNYSMIGMNCLGPTMAKFLRCTVAGGTHTGRGNTILLSGVGAFPAGNQSDITYDDCTFFGASTTTRTIQATSTSFNLTLTGCDIYIKPPDSSHKSFHFTAGNVTLRDCSLKLNASGDPWNNNLIHQPDTAINEGDMLLLDNVRIDCNSVVARCPSANQTAFQFAGRRTILRACAIFNVVLPDDSISASSFHWMNLNPSSVGYCHLVGCDFFDIGNTGVNGMTISLVGQSSGQLGSGSLLISGCQFDTGSHTYIDAASANTMISALGACVGVTIKDNYMANGVWGRVVHISCDGGIIVGNNHFIFNGLFTNKFLQICLVQGPSTSEGIGAYCLFTHNSFVHGDMRSGLAAAEVVTFNRVVVDGNTGIRTAGTAGGNGDLYVHDITALTIHGNNIDGTTTVASITTQKPATLANHNI